VRTLFEWHFAELRDGLRRIWLADRDNALEMLKRLGVSGYLASPSGFGNGTEWRERQRAAFDWLEKWLTGRKGSSLLVCKNPECARKKYFVRVTKQPNKKYCSSACYERVEELRRLERRKQGQRRALSPEGRAAIREGQRKRRQREAAEKQGREPPKKMK